ncbi:MAG: ROK family protein, partial [Clostridia bacterium]|nr:ROK family protein [Clostridia bacterium]
MYTIGVDLGGTNIAIGIVNEKFEIVKKGSVPTKPERGADPIIADMAALSRKLMEEMGIGMDDIAFIGVATPGTANNVTGVVEYANNI